MKDATTTSIVNTAKTVGYMTALLGAMNASAVCLFFIGKSLDVDFLNNPTHAYAVAVIIFAIPGFWVLHVAKKRKLHRDGQQRGNSGADYAIPAPDSEKEPK